MSLGFWEHLCEEESLSTVRDKTVLWWGHRGVSEEKRGESPLVLAPPHSSVSGAQYKGSVESVVLAGIVSVERRRRL